MKKAFFIIFIFIVLLSTNTVFASDTNMVNTEEIIKGVRSVTDIPLIGCTSSGAIITPDGIITSENGFAGMMSFDDPDMVVGVACHESGKDARAIGRKVAIEAVENAKTTG